MDSLSESSEDKKRTSGSSAQPDALINVSDLKFDLALTTILEVKRPDLQLWSFKHNLNPLITQHLQLSWKMNNDKTKRFNDAKHNVELKYSRERESERACWIDLPSL